MFRKVLIASRGAMACRILRTLRRMEIGSVAVYSGADRHSLHVQHADEALLVGPPAASDSYLSVEAILEAARKSNVDAIHPASGFLSENPSFAEACADGGVVFIGPKPEHIRAFGWKHTARKMAGDIGVPLLPGTGLLASAGDAVEAADRIGYPVMLKSATGSGLGACLCRSLEELREFYRPAEPQYLEKFVTCARRIEVQIFGDGKGTVVALGERDCSPQRRNRNIIVETPAPGLRPSIREKMSAAAVRLGEAVHYQSAGSVGFIYDNTTEDFYFLEASTGLQVAHGVTEEVTGIDLVEWMVRLAAGELPDLGKIPIRPTGCAIQAGIYSENPAESLEPTSGRLSHVVWPDQARVDTWVEAGAEVTPFSDPMLATIAVHGENRTEALAHLRWALRHSVIAGIETNLSYLRQVAADPGFQAGGILTSFLGAFEYQRSAIDVIEPGTQTTVQDYPGRSGYWHAGVPPSGPMDALAFRIANRLVGNLDSVAGLEIAVTGPKLRFASDVVIALTGADFGARLDGVRVPSWRSIPVSPGSTLEMTKAQGPGSRAYLAVSGGLNVPEYLESCSTFVPGGFGGHAGRALRAGDVIEVTETGPLFRLARGAPTELIPQYTKKWEIGVLYGPHGAPDFFTPTDVKTFFATAWKVHSDSDRSGVRLRGPKRVWARPDGGKAGRSHSSFHDRASAVGAVVFTGDHPVILGPDGPSLGGYVCPATIVQAELWKMGQLRQGDVVRFVAISKSQAAAMEEQMETAIAEWTGKLPSLPVERIREEPVVMRRPSSGAGSPAMVCRAEGDRRLSIEYGPNALDLGLRARVHALEERLRAAVLPGILDITPGVRSLQVHYDCRVLRSEHLLDALEACEEQISDADDLVLHSRVVHLPLSWGTGQAAGGVEFIRRMNGLDTVDDVHRIVHDANYVVLGLGDGYLGGPVATPVDPRHRLVTPQDKPGPAWKPENAVGIGGAYLRVHGIEAPAGCQFVGQTLQMWNTFRTTAEFEPGTPWLMRSFDQIRFFPVAADELSEIRDAFPYGRYPLRIERQQFRLRDHRDFLASIADSAADFKRRQRAAFLAEGEEWPLAGDFAAESEADMPEGCRAVRSPTTASVWKVAVEPGQRVAAGDKLIVLKAMKMEIAVAAPFSGIIEMLNCVTGAMVLAGQNLVTLRLEAGS
jgi:urea carboxylase